MSLVARFKTRHVQRVVGQYLVGSALVIAILYYYAVLGWLPGTILIIAGLPPVIAYAGRPRLQKKHRFKKIVRSIQAHMPFIMRARKIFRIWRRPDTKLWPDLRRRSAPGLAKYEYSLQSQHGEDGIIRYLFSEAGFTNRYFLEFGFGAAQSNCLRLIMHEKFRGLFIDGSEEQSRLLEAATRNFGIQGIRAACRFLDRDNLEETIHLGNLPRDLDLMSIDVDGNDYWFWERIDFLEPRIVVIEYNAMLGPELSLTVPYDKEFNFHATEQNEAGTFWGASLRALEKLGCRKNYRLVGCDSTGVNAFFLHQDVAADNISTLTAAEAYRPYANWLERGVKPEEQLDLALRMPYVEVEV
jgi:hypothetical protein